MKKSEICYICSKVDEGRNYSFHYGKYVGSSARETKENVWLDQVETRWTEYFSKIKEKTVFICKECYSRNLWQYNLWVLGYRGQFDIEFKHELTVGIIPSFLISLFCMFFGLIITNNCLKIPLIFVAIVFLTGTVTGLMRYREFGHRLAIFNWKEKENLYGEELRTWTPGEFKSVNRN